MAGYPYYNNLSYYGGQPAYMPGSMGLIPNPPTVPPYQPPYSMQGQTPQIQTQSIQQQPPQSMTPPTVHAEIIQAKSVEDVERFPVNAGTTQLFQLGDGEAFITKEVLQNGAANIDIYRKEPKKPAVPPLDPSLYVTREELEKRLESLTRFRRMEETAES